MRTLKKWEHESHSYIPHKVPEEWKISLCEDEMKTIVDCASCGKEIPYGQTLTSLEIHTDAGFGYAVCEECYREEIRRKLKEVHND